jgi:type IV pilus assembly protein PilC
VLAFAVLITLFLVTFVIPRFVEIFHSLGIKLPFLTWMLFQVGLFIIHFWYLCILFVVLTSWGIRHYFSTDKGGYFVDSSKLNLPIVGPLYRKIVLSRFTKTIATLFGSGVSILDALEVTCGVVGNKVYANALIDVKNSVRKGDSIAEALKKTGEFPPDVVQMVAVAEKAGSLYDMLNKISGLYDKTISFSIKKFTTLVEPAILVVVGVMVGFIMASMLLPIFNIVSTVGH